MTAALTLIAISYILYRMIVISTEAVNTYAQNVSKEGENT